MTSEYMNNLYRDLLSNSPQTVTIPIPVSYTHLDVYKRQSSTKRLLTASFNCKYHTARPCNCTNIIFPIWRKLVQVAVLKKEDVYKRQALGVGGSKARFRANMAAIRLLQELEVEGLQASPEQQEILSRYVGWGGLADAFDENKPCLLYTSHCSHHQRGKGRYGLSAAG